MERTSDNRYWVYDSNNATWNQMEKMMLTLLLDQRFPAETSETQRSQVIRNILANVPSQQGEFNRMQEFIPISDKKIFNPRTRSIDVRTAEHRWNFFIPVKHSLDVSLRYIQSYMDSLFEVPHQVILKQFLRDRLSNTTGNLHLKLNGPESSGKSMLISLIEYLFSRFCHRLPDTDPFRPQASEIDYRDVRAVNSDKRPFRIVRLFTLQYDPSPRLPDIRRYSRTPLLLYGTFEPADITIRPLFNVDRNFDSKLLKPANREAFFNWIFL